MGSHQRRQPFILIWLILSLFCLFLTTASGHSEDPWGEDILPKLRVNYLSQKSDSVQSFLGNQTHNDHFKLLRSDGVSLLIGARNVVYNLSLSDLTENRDQRIFWPSDEKDRGMCVIKGKSQDECQNYIRVLAKTDNHNLLVCGTNSFNPRCRTYSSLKEEKAKNETKEEEEEDNAFFQAKHEFSGKGYCPFDPKHNSTAIFSDGELYSGTVADFSGSDPLIIRDRIRTEQFDLKHLNAPNFVSSMEDEDNVYFFFRESAVEYINCGKSVYSRVARVCKNDSGGTHKFKNKWTTFLKSRLNCSVPGEMPFYFNEIQSTNSHMIKDSNGEKIIYGIFTTPENSISGSAVCSFKLSDIAGSFDGDFKGQERANSNWLPVRAADLPEPNVGSCNQDSKELSEQSLNFLKGHSLKDKTISNSHTSPLLVKTSLHERLTVIAVDPQVKTPNGETHDVIFVGTTKGRVIKFVSATIDPIGGGERTNKPIIIEEIQVFPYHVPVTNIEVVKEKGEEVNKQGKLIVLSNHEVKSMPLNRCSAVQVQSCRSCVNLQDPYCAWNVKSKSCVDYNEKSSEEDDISSMVQDVFSGKHPACALTYDDYEQELVEKAAVISNSIDDDKNDDDKSEDIDIVIDIKEDVAQTPFIAEGSTDHSNSSYTSDQLTLASVLVAIFSLLIGFVAGFFTSKRCARSNYNSCGHHYLETHLNKPNDMALAHSESGYTSTPCNNALLSSSNLNPQLPNGDLKNSNLLVNIPTKDDLTEKNAITGVSTTAVLTTNTGTIGRNGTLCKKVYL